MTPTHAQKDVAALAAASLVSALLAQGMPFPRAAETGANYLLLGTGILTPAEEADLAEVLASLEGEVQ